jgi:hypothetical protein
MTQYLKKPENREAINEAIELLNNPSERATNDLDAFWAEVLSEDN